MLSRRNFTKRTVGFTALGMIVASCKSWFKTDESKKYLLNVRQNALLTQVHEHLFPPSEGVPSISLIKSVTFCQHVLNDPQVDEYDKSVFIKGLKWVNNTAKELYGKNFIDADFNEKEACLKDLATYSRGEKWISLNLTYIFEALLADPIYNVNTAEKGWDWLHHQEGYPRPNQKTKYQYL